MSIDKRKLHHEWTILRRLNTWVIGALVIISLLISVFALRQNNLKMIELRNNVLAVDQADGDIDAALRALGDHIVNHMNTSLSRPIELVHSFNRDVEAARAKAEAQTDSKIYQQAQTACEVSSIPLTARAQCIQDFVTENAAPGENPEPLELPSKDFYIYTWAAPLWSPDLAGLSLLAAAFFFLLLVVRVSAGAVIKKILKQHN